MTKVHSGRVFGLGALALSGVVTCFVAAACDSGSGGNSGTAGNTSSSSGASTSGASTSGASTSGASTSGASTSGASTSGASTSGASTTSSGGSTTSSSGSSGGAGSVTFSAGKASGPMTGYGFVAGGTSKGNNAGTPLTTFTTPTCPDGALTGDPGTGCSKTNWGTNQTALCMSGSIPAIVACPATDVTCGATETKDYSEDWGAEVGVGVGATDSVTLGGSYTTVAVTFTGTPGGTVRLQVHTGSGDYCMSGYTSGTPVDASKLVTSCWPGGTSQTPLSSLATISQVQLQIPSGDTATAFTDFCMTGINFQ